MDPLSQSIIAINIIKKFKLKGLKLSLFFLNKKAEIVSFNVRSKAGVTNGIPRYYSYTHHSSFFNGLAMRSFIASETVISFEQIFATASVIGMSIFKRFKIGSIACAVALPSTVLWQVVCPSLLKDSP